MQHIIVGFDNVNKYLNYDLLIFEKKFLPPKSTVGF